MRACEHGARAPFPQADVKISSLRVAEEGVREVEWESCQDVLSCCEWRPQRALATCASCWKFICYPLYLMELTDDKEDATTVVAGTGTRENNRRERDGEIYTFFPKRTNHQCMVEK